MFRKKEQVEVANQTQAENDAFYERPEVGVQVRAYVGSDHMETVYKTLNMAVKEYKQAKINTKVAKTEFEDSIKNNTGKVGIAGYITGTNRRVDDKQRKFENNVRILRACAQRLKKAEQDYEHVRSKTHVLDKALYKGKDAIFTWDNSGGKDDDFMFFDKSDLEKPVPKEPTFKSANDDQYERGVTSKATLAGKFRAVTGTMDLAHEERLKRKPRSADPKKATTTLDERKFVGNPNLRLNMALKELKKNFFGPTYPRKLYVTLIGGSGLPKVNTIGHIDAFAVIRTKSEKKTPFRSRTAPDYGANPLWNESTLLDIKHVKDTVMVEVYDGSMQTEGKYEFIGQGPLPLTPAYIKNSEVAIEIYGRQGEFNGIVRLDAVWADEAGPKHETGRFFYRVVYDGGVRPRTGPDLDAPVFDESVFKKGEVVEASERLRHPDEDTVFVKVNSHVDKWHRRGWVPETVGDYLCLERVAPPRIVHGIFCYRVAHPDGVRLKGKADGHAYGEVKGKAASTAMEGLKEKVWPMSSILVATEKITPLGSNFTYAKIGANQGYVVEQNDGGISMFYKKKGKQPLVEHCNLTDPTDRRRDVGEFFCQVVIDSGVIPLQEPSIDAAPTQFSLQAGDVFVASEVLLRFYPGVGEIPYLRIADEQPGVLGQTLDNVKGCWVPENHFYGTPILQPLEDEKYDLDDEAGKFKIVYPSGVAVRVSDDVTSEKTGQVIVAGTIIECDTRVVKARELLKSIATGQPPVPYLHLADGSGWIFESYFSDAKKFEVAKPYGIASEVAAQEREKDEQVRRRRMKQHQARLKDNKRNNLGKGVIVVATDGGINATNKTGTGGILEF